MLKHRCHLCFAVSPSSSSSHTRQLVFAAAPEASAPPGSLAAGILPLCNQRAGLLQPGPSSKQLSCSASTDTHHLSLLPPLCLVIVCVSALLLPLLSVLMLCCGATDVRHSGLTEFRVGRQVCDSLLPVNEIIKSFSRFCLTTCCYKEVSSCHMSVLSPFVRELE